MASDIEVFGIDKLEKDLSSIADKMTKKELAKLIRPGAVIFQKEIKAQAPRRTGTLQRAVRVRIGRGKASDPAATVETYFAKIYKSPRTGAFVRPYYSWFVEQGTKERFRGKKQKKQIPTGSIKANNFVARAFDAKVNEAARLILDKIAKSVEQ